MATLSINRGEQINMIVEKDTWFMNGYISSLVIVVLLFVAFLNIFYQQMVIAIISFVLAIVLMTGLTIVQPNEIVVVQFFGMYIGTIRNAGWMMTVPLTTKSKISRKMQRFTTDDMYIKNQRSDIIQLSSVITYNIVDAAKALFAVDTYLGYLKLEAYLLTNTKATKFMKEESSIDMTALNQEVKQALQENIQFAGIDITDVHCVIVEKGKA